MRENVNRRRSRGEKWTEELEYSMCRKCKQEEGQVWEMDRGVARDVEKVNMKRILNIQDSMVKKP